MLEPVGISLNTLFSTLWINSIPPASLQPVPNTLNCPSPDCCQPASQGCPPHRPAQPDDSAMKETDSLNSSNDVWLDDSQTSHSPVYDSEDPFLNFLHLDPIVDLSFEDESKIFCSLVNLVDENYPFDEDIQEGAVSFLQRIEPNWNERRASKLATDLVPSSPGLTSGTVYSILTLVSCPYSSVSSAALSLMNAIFFNSSPTIRSHLVESDLVASFIATVHPQTMSISDNTAINNELSILVTCCLNLAFPTCLEDLGVTAADSREVGSLFRGLDNSLIAWKTEGPEVVQSAKRTMQALISEGIEDSLEQMIMNDKGGNYGVAPIDDCADCWCGRTDSGIASNRPEMVCSFVLVVLNAAVFDCHIVNRPLSTQFLICFSLKPTQSQVVSVVHTPHFCDPSLLLLYAAITDVSILNLIPLKQEVGRQWAKKQFGRHYRDKWEK
ncbi:hypothetical protein BLNAU_7251 [Blattamonas nauphoetae]|uniref:Uncharacterized protein n=1 Tax=Blattamonas nauphoetae TaxID=2049346 RepID=A0ABQ9Y238_9EUKA|nr:hypothetical protein BLNAU_7251 [Blattamonas nauphoetae]